MAWPKNIIANMSRLCSPPADLRRVENGEARRLQDRSGQGIRTVSAMFMTPLDCITLAMLIFDVPPLASGKAGQKMEIFPAAIGVELGASCGAPSMDSMVTAKVAPSVMRGR